MLVLHVPFVNIILIFHFVEEQRSLCFPNPRVSIQGTLPFTSENHAFMLPNSWVSLLDEKVGNRRDFRDRHF